MVGGILDRERKIVERHQGIGSMEESPRTLSSGAGAKQSGHDVPGAARFLT